MMKSCERPPNKVRKGIKVLQPAQGNSKMVSEEQSSGVRSVRSSSRSRGISMSR